MIFYGLVATEFRAFVDVSRKIEGSLWYQPQQDDTKENNNTVEQISPALFLNSIFIEDRKGNRYIENIVTTTAVLLYTMQQCSFPLQRLNLYIFSDGLFAKQTSKWIQANDLLHYKVKHADIHS